MVFVVLQDRKASCVNAIHSSDIHRLCVPYVVPQENGNRTDVHWVQLSNTNAGNSRKADHDSHDRHQDDDQPNRESNNTCNSNSTNIEQGTGSGGNKRRDAGAMHRLSISEEQEDDDADDHDHDDDVVVDPALANDGTHTFEHHYDEDRAGELRFTLNDPDHTQPTKITNNKSGYEGNIDTNGQASCSESLSHQLQHTNLRPAVRISQRNINHTFNFSIEPFTVEDLQRVSHWHTLEYFPRPYLSLNIDPHLQGIGGDDSVSASVGDDYLLLPDNYTFDLLFNFFDDAR